MTLRTRLMAAALAVVVLVIVVLSAMVLRQESVLLDQIDSQLLVATEVTPNSPLANVDVELLEARRTEAFTSGDMYAAIIDESGTVRPVALPAGEQTFAPDEAAMLSELAAGRVNVGGDTQPFTVDATTGGEARVVAVDIGNSRTLVLARSLELVAGAQRGLLGMAGFAVAAIVATLAVAMWWVDRLGLQPVGRLTEAAEAVASGRSDERVDHPPLSTETGRLGAAFNTMLDAREEAENRQRRFVADASHELRTPLTTLRGYAALHASGGLATGDAVADAMRRINSEADRMAALVEDLLTLASLDDGRPLDVSPVDLSRLLHDVASDAAAVQPERRVCAAGVTPGLAVNGDEHLLVQAITAVTSNSIRHTPAEAGLRLSAQRRRDGAVVLTIADGGPGMDEAQVDQIFERFYRADSARSGAAGGRGLGLSITRTVIDAHGGTVTARSSRDQGTSVTLALPGRST
ncbi:MAG: HAMP domain-containing sensor histidine kinase [Actinomycetota bacterium]